mgnify:FL=1
MAAPANEPGAELAAAPLSLAQLGWRDREREAFKEVGRDDLMPARVVGLHRNHVVDLMTGELEIQGRPAGKLLQDKSDTTSLPAVGDWVACDDEGTVHEVLPRRTTLARRVASTSRSAEGRDRIQVLAANVDLVIVVSSLNKDHDIERLSRMVALAEASGAATVVALSKSDLVDDFKPQVDEATAAFPNSRVLAFSSPTGDGLEALRENLRPAETVVLLGSSGVGKSTLANKLLGYERQKTLKIRKSDDRGRHATTSRELFALPTGALLLPTPGLRAPGALVDDRPDDRAAEIEKLSEFCKFRDCRHQSEPGCAVTAAVAAGDLPPA